MHAGLNTLHEVRPQQCYSPCAELMASARQPEATGAGTATALVHKSIVQHQQQTWRWQRREAPAQALYHFPRPPRWRPALRRVSSASSCSQASSALILHETWIQLPLCWGLLTLPHIIAICPHTLVSLLANVNAHARPYSNSLPSWGRVFAFQSPDIGGLAIC